MAPYVGLLLALGLGAWQAYARSSADFSVEAGDSLLRQDEALSRELRAAQRECRKAEAKYQAMVAWGVQVMRQVAREAPGVTLLPMPLPPINGEGQDLPALTDRDEVRLRRLLVERMQAEDLRTLAFDLGADDVRGETTGELARALLDHVRSRRKWADLLKWLADNRPDIQT